MNFVRISNLKNNINFENIYRDDPYLLDRFGTLGNFTTGAIPKQNAKYMPCKPLFWLYITLPQILKDSQESSRSP
jgi:hypothetical protein